MKQTDSRGRYIYIKDSHVNTKRPLRDTVLNPSLAVSFGSTYVSSGEKKEREFVVSGHDGLSNICQRNIYE